MELNPFQTPKYRLLHIVHPETEPYCSCIDSMQTESKFNFSGEIYET
jgi:hypothetical protein